MLSGFISQFLITGGAGFIGSHLIDLLIERKLYGIYIWQPGGTSSWALDDMGYL